MTKKLTNSPESESASFDKNSTDSHSSSVAYDLLRLRLGKNQPMLFDMDVLVDFIAAHDSALLDKVEGLIGPDILEERYMEVGFNKGQRMRGRDELRAELRAEIAKLRKGEA